MNFANKVVFVTGAAQGMGRAICRRFGEFGAKVVAVDIKLEAAAETIADLGERGLALACNVADAEAVRQAFAEVEARFGGVDVVVNSAGIGAASGFPDISDDNWTRVIGVNLTGTFLCCREGVRLMQKHGIKGALINVSSTGAFTGEGPVPYIATKAGVIGLTRSIAREVAASGIRINTIVPGATNTPMLAGIPEQWMQAMIQAIPLGRVGEPEDIARLATFLASDDAAYITGQNMAVNGGMSFL